MERFPKKDMIGDNIPGETKPVEGECSKDIALLGDAVGKDYIKGGNSVGGNDNKMAFAKFVDIPHLPPFEELQAF
jgi:hypothetical protein